MKAGVKLSLTGITLFHDVQVMKMSHFFSSLKYSSLPSASGQKIQSWPSFQEFTVFQRHLSVSAIHHWSSLPMSTVYSRTLFVGLSGA